MTDDDNNVKDDFAYMASASTNPCETQRLSNLQLKSWMDAKEKYNKLIKGNSNPASDDMILIVNLLGDSLTYLFGANYNQGERTPTLRYFIDKIFPDREWDLESDNPNLYSRFCDLDEFHKDVSKHFSRNKIPKTMTLTKQKLEEYMYTTKDIWLWFMDKHYSGKIPEDQLLEFNDI